MNGSVRILAVIAILVIARTAHPDAETAYAEIAYVTQLTTRLGTILSLPVSPQRDRRLGRFFERHFDFAAFEARVLVDAAPHFSKPQRARFSRAFKQMLLARLIAAVDAEHEKSAGGHYTVDKAPAADCVVLTFRSKEGDYTILLHVAKSGAGRRIVDVSIESVLLSRNYRGSVNGIIRRLGVAALIERVNAKARAPRADKGLF